ncbi:erythromycin esterase family protein [Flindersiella endophytica]
MNPRADLTDFLRSLPARPALLGIGEPTHGVEQFPRLRNDIFRHLVEREGYRSIALESDCLLALTVDDHVVEGEGTLDDAMDRGFSHGIGAFAANRELVAWMHDYNAGCADPEDRLRFYGFDAPLELHSAASPGPALLGAHGYLAGHLGSGQVPYDAGEIRDLVGDDAVWSSTEAVLDHTKSVGGSEGAGRLRIIADDLIAQLLMHAPPLIAATSRTEWWRANLHARSAAGLLRYHAVLASQGIDRIERGSAVRDLQMADNLVAIREYEAQRGPTLVFAHNVHLQLNQATMHIPEGWQELAGSTLRWWNAGALAAARLGRRQYAFLATDYGEPPLLGLHTSAQLAALPELRSNTTDTYTYIPFELERLDGLDGIIFAEPVKDS